ncbi:MAG TPA: drug/metabolite exporter YedA [Thermoanaerobaculaceae bacterium]|nr:drug/metabolite exporter YedA [Thermoanaerobaculaceae bacterium]
MKKGSFSPAGGWFPIAAAMLAVYILWGSTYLAIRIALEGLPPFLMAGVRFLVAGGVLFVALWLRGAPAPSARQWRNAALVGGLLLLGGNGGVVVAEQWVASGLAALGVATVGLWSALFAGLWGQWPRRMEWVGLAVGFGGVALLSLEGGLRASPAGAAALLVGTMSWALGSMWSRRLDLPSGLMAAAAEMLAGGAMLVAVGVGLREKIPSALAPRPLFALAYLIVFGSWIGFSAYLFLLRRVRPAAATSYAYVNPVIAMFLGVALGGETITAAEWAAMPVILAGVAIVMVAHGRAEATAAAAGRHGTVRS